MNELTVEHLAPYLPYGLRLLYEETDSVGKVVSSKVGIMKGVHHNTIESNPTRVSIGFGDTGYIWMFKPILRPLSDLEKELTINGITFIPEDKLSNSTQMQIICFRLPLVNDLKVYDYQKLLSWHFDVFKLIDKGLAVNINTLNNL